MRPFFFIIIFFHCNIRTVLTVFWLAPPNPKNKLVLLQKWKNMLIIEENCILNVFLYSTKNKHHHRHWTWLNFAIGWRHTEPWMLCKSSVMLQHWQRHVRGFGVSIITISVCLLVFQVNYVSNLLIHSVYVVFAEWRFSLMKGVERSARVH